MLPTYTPIDINKYEELDAQQMEDILSNGYIVGLDSKSITKLVLTSPFALWHASVQKIYDLILFYIRAGWSELSIQHRNAEPWMGAAIEWGLTSDELYANAHGLPKNHKLKNPGLAAAKQMVNWETTHSTFAQITSLSRPLDRLIGQPIPMGSDGWPLPKLDENADEYTDEYLIANAELFYFRQPQTNSLKYRQRLAKLTQNAVADDRLIIIQPA